TLTKDSPAARLRDESRELGELAAKLDRIIQGQRALFDKIVPGKTGKGELRKQQVGITRTTRLLAKQVEGRAPAEVRNQLLAAADKQAQAEKVFAGTKPNAATKQLGEALRTLVGTKLRMVELRTAKEEEALALLLKDVVNRCDNLLEVQRGILEGTLR